MQFQMVHQSSYLNYDLYQVLSSVVVEDPSHGSQSAKIKQRSVHVRPKLLPPMNVLPNFSASVIVAKICAFQTLLLRLSSTMIIKHVLIGRQPSPPKVSNMSTCVKIESARPKLMATFRSSIFQASSTVPTFSPKN